MDIQPEIHDRGEAISERRLEASLKRGIGGYEGTGVLASCLLVVGGCEDTYKKILGVTRGLAIVRRKTDVAKP